MKRGCFKYSGRKSYRVTRAMFTISGILECDCELAQNINSCKCQPSSLDSDLESASSLAVLKKKLAGKLRK